MSVELKQPPEVTPKLQTLLKLRRACCDAGIRGKGSLKWSCEVDGLGFKIIPAAFARGIMYRAGIKWITQKKGIKQIKAAPSTMRKRDTPAFLSNASGTFHVTGLQLCALAFQHTYLVVSFPFVGVDAAPGVLAIGAKDLAIGAVDTTDSNIDCCPPQMYMNDSKPLLSIQEVAFEGNPSSRDFTLSIRDGKLAVSRQVPLGNIISGLLLQRKAVRTFAKKLAHKSTGVSGKSSDPLVTRERSHFQVKLNVVIDKLALELEEDGDVKNEFVYAKDSDVNESPSMHLHRKGAGKLIAYRDRSVVAQMMMCGRMPTDANSYVALPGKRIRVKFQAHGRAGSGILLFCGQRTNVLTIATTGWKGKLVWDSEKHSKTALLKRMRELEDTEFRGPGIDAAHRHGFPFVIGGDFELFTVESLRMQLRQYACPLIKARNVSICGTLIMGEIKGSKASSRSSVLAGQEKFGEMERRPYGASSNASSNC